MQTYTYLQATILNLFGEIGSATSRASRTTYGIVSRAQAAIKTTYTNGWIFSNHKSNVFFAKQVFFLSLQNLSIYEYIILFSIAQLRFYTLHECKNKQYH